MKLLDGIALGSAVLCCAITGSLRAQSTPAVVPGGPAPAAVRVPEPPLRSRMFIYNLRDGSSKLVFTADTIWEAPSWSPDGKYLIANSGGGIYRLTLQPDGTATPVRLPLGDQYRCNNDKALSPDGKLLGFSATVAPAKGSNVYLANADGSGIRQMTTETPSYFHGWSPDNKTMAFVAQRNGSKQYDIYRLPTAGGTEQQMTSDIHHDDGPDYSPDGKWIYINSDRSGHESVWRLPADGAGPNDSKAQMVLADGLEDWFPHISPDGKKLLYVGYPAGTPTHNPRTVHIELKLATVDHDKVSQTPKLLTGATGGQGSLNVNSWAPDSERFAYVTYEAIP